MSSIRRLTTILTAAAAVAAAAAVSAAPAIGSPSTTSDTAGSVAQGPAGAGYLLLLRDHSLYELNLASGHLDQLTYYDHVYGPAEYSPDGKRIAYAVFERANLDVHTMSVSGSDDVQLTSRPSSEFSPTWSRDGKQLAMISTAFGHEEVFRISSSRPGPATRVTQPEKDCDDYEPWGYRAPKWSPTSDQILVMFHCSSKITGYDDEGFAVIRASDGKDMGTWVPAMDGDRPSWFPNGRDFVYKGTGMTNFEGGYPPCVERAHTGSWVDSKELTTCFEDSPTKWGDAPVVSPDGKTIAYECGVKNVCTMTPTGTNKKTILKGNIRTVVLDWRR